MSDHGYEAGRLNLPFVGISTFGKRPYVADWDAIEADVAVLGAPFDFGTQWRPGARFGPRAVREASKEMRRVVAATWCAQGRGAVRKGEVGVPHGRRSSPCQVHNMSGKIPEHTVFPLLRTHVAPIACCPPTRATISGVCVCLGVEGMPHHKS